MKLARIKLDQQIYYARINDDQTATLVDGDIFGPHIDLTNTTIPLRRLRTPRTRQPTPRLRHRPQLRRPR